MFSETENIIYGHIMTWRNGCGINQYDLEQIMKRKKITGEDVHCAVEKFRLCGLITTKPTASGYGFLQARTPVELAQWKQNKN